MSLWTDIEAAGEKVEGWLTAIGTGAKKLQAIYNTLSGPTLAAVAAVFYDVVKAVAAGTEAATDAATGNTPAAFVLSETTLTLVKQVVADAKAGEKTVVADWEALGLPKL
jgi:hypothetical protein